MRGSDRGSPARRRRRSARPRAPPAPRRRPPGRRQAGRRADRRERGQRWLRAVARGEPRLGRLVRVAEARGEKEAVHLAFHQRKRARLIDRVLGRQHEMRLGQRPGLAVDGDLALLHRLEQGRLASRRGPVQLVEEHHVGEDGARPEVPGVRRGREDRDTGDVGRQKVRVALDAGEASAYRDRDRLCEHRLADTRHVFDEEVSRPRARPWSPRRPHREYRARPRSDSPAATPPARGRRRATGSRWRLSRGHRLSRTTPHAERAYCHFRHLSFQLFTAPARRRCSAGARRRATRLGQRRRQAGLRLSRYGRDALGHAADVSSSTMPPEVSPAEDFACQGKGFLGRRLVKRFEHRLGKSSRDGFESLTVSLRSFIIEIPDGEPPGVWYRALSPAGPPALRSRPRHVAVDRSTRRRK